MAATKTKKPKARREYGSGSAYEKALGKWEAAIRINGRIVRRAATSREEAEAARAALVAQRAAAEQATQVQRTLSDSLRHAVNIWLAHVDAAQRENAERMLTARIYPALDEWRRLEAERADLSGYTQTNGVMFNDWYADAERTRNLTWRTLKTYRNLLVGYILPALENIPMCNTDARLIQQTVNDIRQEIAENSVDEDTGLSRYTGVGTARMAFGLMHDAYTIAVQRGYLMRNPCDGVRLPASDTQARRAMTDDELRRFVRVALDHPFRSYWCVLALMGFRRAEPLGMTWANVDWQARTLDFTKQVQIVGTSAELQDPKNKASRRKLPAPNLVYDTLAEQYEQTPTAQRMGLIWPAPDGRPLRPDRVNIMYADLLAAAGLDPALTPHYHRHTIATLIDETDGATESLKSGILGHGKKSISQLYTHARVEAMRRVLLAVEARVLAANTDASKAE